MQSTITTRLDQTPEDSGMGAAARRQPPPAYPELADRVKELLPDGVIDELLASVATEQQITWQAGCWANCPSGWWSARWKSNWPTTSAMKRISSRRVRPATPATVRHLGWAVSGCSRQLGVL